MKTWCRYCDELRAFAMGRVAAILHHERKPPDGYEDFQIEAWLRGYDLKKPKGTA